MGRLTGVGAVVIGRNEGERLARCLRSLVDRVETVVYVDSGSTDSSCELARGLGVRVIDLERDRPFTAARARNAGFEELLRVAPGCELVQFVDGDCEVVPGWLEQAAEALRRDRELVVVCGRRRERHPEVSLWNALIDVEWDAAPGETRSCGGDAMYRADALREVGGFDPTLIAGEEPELCLRLRRRGGKVFRLPAEMTLHDAAMVRFSQWWLRSVRAGHAFAEGAHRHGSTPERFRVREHRRIWVFALLIPLAALAAAPFTWGASLLLPLSACAFSVWRAYRHALGRGRRRREAALWGFFCVLGRLPELQGAIRFRWNSLRGRRAGLIEYK